MREGHAINQNAHTPITSTLLDDPEMAELVEYFVNELDQHVHTLQIALESRDLETLRRVSHQLKGAAGGYGFPAIGEAAAHVEHAVETCGADDIASLRTEVDTLVDMCRRATI